MIKLKFTSQIPTQESIFSLYSKLGWSEYLKLDCEQLHKAMLQSYYSIYVYSDNKLIGTGRVISDGIINAYICGLGVLDQYRHNGIGTQIFNRLVEHCLSNNLHIQLFCERYLVNFYEKMGFTEFAVGMNKG